MTAPVLPAVAIVTRHDDGTLTVRPAEFTPAEECDRAWYHAKAVVQVREMIAERERFGANASRAFVSVQRGHRFVCALSGSWV